MKKSKKCKVCQKEFTPFNSLQKVCSSNCAIQLAKKQKKIKDQKEWQKEKKERKEKLMSHSDWLQVLQVTFNAFIRERDKGLPCISCGTLKGQFHAGHYRSVGAFPELRFNEDNVHIQCATCNNYLSGNLIEYRKGLIKKIGVDKVEALENFNQSNKMTIAEIKEKISLYKEKIKQLKA